MTTGVMAAVLFAALLHASWNALVKSGDDKPLDIATMHSLGAFAALPLLAIVGLPPAAAWPWIAASIVIHLGYYTALAGAYRHGDLTVTYPIMRGLAPVLVGLASAPLVGETLPLAAWVAVLGVSLGVLLLGLASAPRWTSGLPRMPGPAVRWALLNAAIIAAYTVVDGLGIRTSVEHGGSALQYVAALFLIDGLPYLVLVLWQRGARDRPAAWAQMRRRAPVLAVGMLASLGSYGIALWAMTRAPIAAVAALREVSVLFAALIGTRLLGERFGPRRATGTMLILGGVAALRLA
jgi:phosphonate utilization associated putative membrane protein